jgi:hypothetical protein
MTMIEIIDEKILRHDRDVIGVFEFLLMELD